MMLHNRIFYAGIRTSRKVARLSWFQRDFFHGLILVADDFGRFEADAELLRTVLFAPCFQKVSTRDVQGALVACHEAGLVKLYQSGARGYGEVIKFRQTLRERRALYPAEEAPPPEPELFVEHPPPDLPTKTIRRKEGRKGEEGGPPPPESQEVWLTRLRAAHPHIDVDRELAGAQKNRQKAGKKLDRRWFEQQWLANIGPTVEFVTNDRSVPVELEPEGWREAIADTVYGRDGIHEVETWAGLPREARRWVIERLRDGDTERRREGETKPLNPEP